MIPALKNLMNTEEIMANSPQARKRARQAITRRDHNMSLRSRMRTYVKRVLAAIQLGDAAKAKDAYQEAVPVIDTMVSKGIIHKNQAARKKSRLSSSVKKLNTAK
jgi:small subunit ribosomal protein S20